MAQLGVGEDEGLEPEGPERAAVVGDDRDDWLDLTCLGVDLAEICEWVAEHGLVVGLGDGIGKVAGSSLHAGVAARADERKKLERLCRYISRPAVSEKRLSLTRGGNVRYQLKTPYRDGTTHVIFEPLDFIARLAALVPKPRVNLTRFHGVFAPNSRHRALVTPAKRGRGNKVRVADEPATPAQRRASMTWAQRLKRVFNIDIETCSGCGGAMKVIACIEDPIVIKQILDHLKHKAETSGTRALPESRAPPAELLLGLFD